ncbi:MAG: hypothetical protein U0236_09610 [Nitrospira sp.]
MTIQRIWPDGAQRHRALGRFTMVIYCVLFMTGSFTYTMLYILYPLDSSRSEMRVLSANDGDCSDNPETHYSAPEFRDADLRLWSLDAYGGD